MGGEGGISVHTAAKFVREEELLRLLMSGFMLKECSMHMGVSYGTLRKYAREPGFLEKLKVLSQNVYERVDEELRKAKDSITERLESISESALEEMWELSKTAQGMVKFKVLQDLMDRDTRISRQKKVEAQTSHSFVDPLFLVHAAGVAREMDAKALKAKEITNGGNSENGGPSNSGEREGRDDRGEGRE